MTEINASSDGQSKQLIVVKNPGVINTGDTYEAQREVLPLDVDRWRPQRQKKLWVERTQVQAELKQRIEDSATPLVEIVAAGGFGKSFLADWAYEQTKGRFTKALWLNCRNQPTFNAVSREVLQELGFLIRDDATPNDWLVNQLAYRLSQCAALVVIDQLEAVVEREDWLSFAGFFTQWQARGEGSMVVLTTRQPVLSTEQHRLALGGFTAEEGATYLSRRGIQARGDTELAQLAQLGQGHPLLLELAGSWLQETANSQLSADDLAFFERLFEQAPLAAKQSDPAAVSDSRVEQVFQLLLARLVPHRRELLLAVSVYQRPFTLAQAQAMAPQTVVADLKALTGRGFLMAQEQAWTLHPLVQTLVNAELTASGQADTAHQQAAAYFAEQLQAKTVDLEDILECFHHHYQRQDYSAAYETIRLARDWMQRRGFNRRLSVLYGQLVRAWQETPPVSSEGKQQFGGALNTLGIAYDALGEYRRAIDFLQQALEIYRAIKDRNGEATALNNLGNAYFFLGEYRRAIDFLQQALEIQRAIEDRNGEADALGNMGNAYDALGEYRRAIDFYQQALEIKRAIKDRNGEATALGSLGIGYDALGEYRRAIDFLQQALEIYRAIKDRNGEATALGNMGNAYRSLGEYRRAIDFYQQALEIYRAIEDRNGEASLLYNCAIALAKIDDYWAARENLMQAREIWSDLQLDHLIEQCDTAIRKFGQIIAAQPRPAPTISSLEPAQSSEDWWEKSMPTPEASRTTGQGRQPWEVYVVLAVVVFILILILQ